MLLRKLILRSRLPKGRLHVKRAVHASRLIQAATDSGTGDSEEKNLSSRNRSQTYIYGLLVVSPDALPLS